MVFPCSCKHKPFCWRFEFDFEPKPIFRRGNILDRILRSVAHKQTRQHYIKITFSFFEIKLKKPNGKQKLNLLFDLKTISLMFAPMPYNILQEAEQGFFFNFAKAISFFYNTTK